MNFVVWIYVLISRASSRGVMKALQNVALRVRNNHPTQTNPTVNETIDLSPMLS